MWRKVGAETETVGAVTEGGHLPRTPLKDNCYHFTIFTQPLYSHIVNIADLPPIVTFSWKEILYTVLKRGCHLSSTFYQCENIINGFWPRFISPDWHPIVTDPVKTVFWFLKSKHKHNRLEMTQWFSLGLFVFCCCWGAAKITCCPPPCSEQEACVAQGSKLPAINNVNLGQLANPRHYPICSVVQPPGQTPYTALMCATAKSSYHLDLAPDIILFVRLHKSDILLKGSSLYFSKVIAIGPCWHWTLADVSISPLQCSVEGKKI